MRRRLLRTFAEAVVRNRSVTKRDAVTNGLVALLAAGMAGQAAVYLVQANLIPSLGDQVWDTSWLLRDDGLIGRALHALVGYSDRPMGVQVASYLVVLAVLISLGRYIGSAPGEPRPAG